jgi:hydrogenase nickel incorporation protein HypA/HybF
MHELSIALSILDIVESACRDHDCSRVELVRVRVGRAAGVMSDSLSFSFDAAKGGTVAEGALLEIDEVPVGGRCRGCASDFTVEEKFVFACPNCGGTAFTVHSGHELEVVDLEVDE